jgi:P27 family predicted phage terminase small subunit
MAPPKTLPDGARDAWVEIVDALAALPVVSRVDLVALEALSLIVSRWRQAEARIEADGLFLVHPNGHVYAHPAVKVAEKAQAEFVKWSEKFGLSPKDRVGLGIDLLEAEAMQNRIESKIGPSPRRRGA